MITIDWDDIKYVHYNDDCERLITGLTDADLDLDDPANEWEWVDLDPDWMLEIAEWRDGELLLDLTGNLDAPL